MTPFDKSDPVSISSLQSSMPQSSQVSYTHFRPEKKEKRIGYVCLRSVVSNKPNSHTYSFQEVL